MHEKSPDDPSDPAISKTRRKEAMHALQDMGERLVQLDPKRLAELSLPEVLAEAILEARRMHKHGARRRQMQFIGKLMRTVDAAPIQEKMDAWSRTGIQHKAWLHLLERWRERLLADDQALAELKLSYPALQDLHHLHTLVRNAREEKRMDKPPRSYRALFHELRQIIPEESPGREADGAHEWESIKT
jgi:ribosome-associated protein